MAGVAMLLLLPLLLIPLTLPPVSGTSQLYDKIRTLMENKEFQRTVAEVKRDMDAEMAERELEEDKEERLISQLKTLLNPDDADEDEPSKREYDRESPYKRLVDILQRRDAKDEVWYDEKPALNTLDDGCYLRKHYETLWPNECNYYLKENDKACLDFCTTWLANIKQKYNLPLDCKYDNKYSGAYCENKIGKGTKKKCSVCKKNGYFYPNCCGSCKRNDCV
ncbi:uncharacterized protein LOC124146910 [Haliotis rufescens]|uniref:uncharacterized protein LOC124146910 n=1 Tax=Haliotis rufescens TaxID=6454 RepID=UPI00201FA9D9|nr:uncharacterized protein LOC124146910 [Haliotis rufescens]